MKKIIPLLVGLVLLGTSCSVFESSSPTKINTCKTEGIVKDFTGLDGCGLLIVKKDGSKLIPLSVPDSFELKAGQQILFDYVEEPMANICMAGPTVRITCIREESRTKCDQKGSFHIADLIVYQTTRRSSFKVFNTQYSDNLLTLDIGYSGCSPKRDFSLIGSPASAKSIPPQKTVKLKFPEQMCEAWFRQRICFDVSAIKEKTVLIFWDDNEEHRITVGE